MFHFKCIANNLNTLMMYLYCIRRRYICSVMVVRRQGGWKGGTTAV